MVVFLVLVSFPFMAVCDDYLRQKMLFIQFLANAFTLTSDS